MIELFKGILGGLGVIQNNLNYADTEFGPFVSGLPAGTVVNVSDKTPGFFPGAIRAITASPWDHSLLYVGKSAGNWIREKYPELLGKREMYFQGKRHDLGKVSGDATFHETLESKAKIAITKLDNYNNKDTAMEAWSRPLTSQELESVLFNAYLMVGMPYDVSEIASYVLPVTNPTIKNMPVRIITEAGIYYTSFRVCSTYMTWTYHEVEDLYKPGWNPEKLPPGHLHKYFVWANGWSRRLFGCKKGVPLSI